MSKNTISMHISEDLLAKYRRDGYFLLENAIPLPALEGLRQECHRYVDQYEAEMEARGVKQIGINHYKRRYFISGRGLESGPITDFLFGDLMADITRAVLGDTVYLFNEQYVVKAADIRTQFSWHQDSGYIPHYHAPYLSCWCALDDVDEENGTIYVLPYERAGMQPDDHIRHDQDPDLDDMVGYKGDDPGDPVIVPAGSIAVFSSRLLHRSGPNKTDRYRRVYLAQYSAEPIMNTDGSALWNQAVPFWEDGIRRFRIKSGDD